MISFKSHTFYYFYDLLGAYFVVMELSISIKGGYKLDRSVY